MDKLIRQGTFFIVPILFIALTYYFGENHPFSRFPMYSTLPTSADYFYLADSSGKPLSSYLNFKFRTNELKDMLQIKVKNYELDRSDNTQLGVAAKEVLNFIAERNSHNPWLKNLGKISLVRHEIRKEGNTLRESDTVLAVMNSRDKF